MANRGRPKKEKESDMQITMPHQYSESESDVTQSAQDAEFQVWWNKQKAREALIKRGKKSLRAVGYVYTPYFNKPKKHHLGKLSVRLENVVRGITYSVLVARDVSQVACSKIINLKSDDVNREHKKRIKQPNYGF